MISFSPVEEKHLPVLSGILNYYVEHTTVTFHKELLAAEDMREKVFFSSPVYKAFLITFSGETIGFCAVSPWKKQEAYRHTAEINIYLHHAHTGKGIGSVALKQAETWAKENDIRTLIGGISGENTASQKLFLKNGYHPCAHFREVGHKFGRVLDTLYFQKMLGVG